jgi:sodium/hydrogen antiporter
VLISLLAVGLRLRVPPRLSAWRVALLMAGPGMVVAIVVATGAAVWLLGLPWPAALLLAAILAPTDPVLASEVQIKSDEDRDAVRLSLTAEGGLNDGSALPAVMLALGLMGLHTLGAQCRDWWLNDLAWAIGGGALLGMATGSLLGWALRARIKRRDMMARDELLYVGALALAYGLARATGTSSFVVVFAVGATLLWPFHEHTLAHGGQALAERLGAFGQRLERLVEAAGVLGVGLLLHSVPPSWPALAFALVLVLVVRPLSVFSVVRLRRGRITQQQRRLVAWFGIRGIGSLFYLAFVLDHGVHGPLAQELIGATLATVALSIVLHGISATPVMGSYQRRRRNTPAPTGQTSDSP